MIIKRTERIFTRDNPQSYAGEVFFVRNKKNKDLVYTSNSKCKSMEYLFDNLISETAMVIYEKLDNNKIYLIVTNSDVKTFKFDISSEEFDIKKVEDIINIILIKRGIETTYFIEGSTLMGKININCKLKETILKKDFKKLEKQTPILKTARKYTFATFVLTVFLTLSYLGLENATQILTQKKGEDFNNKFSALEKEISLKNEELYKYSALRENNIEVLNKLNPSEQVPNYLQNDITNNFLMNNNIEAGE